MYTEEEIRLWISERLPKGIKSLTTSIRNSKTMQEALMHHTVTHADLSFSARACIIYHGKRPVCMVCGSYTYFNRNRWEFGETCSMKCGANNERRNEQIKSTLLDRYGVDNISKSDYFHEKMKNNNLEKHGVEHYMQTEEFRRKTKTKCLEKYGVENYAQTFEFKEKYKSACTKKHGAVHYSQTFAFQEKYKTTCLNRYGVDHPMKTLEIFEKQQKNSYYYKDYVMPSGKIVRIQGYENLALDELLQSYKEEDLLISNRDIFAQLGVFTYTYNGKSHRYYPDIYLIPENLFIEVKSTRTFSVNKKKNLLKRECVLEKNHNFSFWIYGKDGKEVL